MRFLQPLDLVSQFMAQMCGGWVIGLVFFSLPMLLVAPWLGVNPAPVSVLAGVLFLVSVIGTMAIGVAFDFIFAAFLTHFEGGAYIVARVRIAISLVLSGALVPLALLPWNLGAILQWLPFASLASAPLRIYTGTGDAHFLLALQTAWAVVLWVLARRLWRLYAWLDFMWVTRSFEKFAVYYLGDAMINAAAISSTLLLAERFDGLGPWSKAHVMFMLGYAAMTTGLLEIFCGYNVLYIGRRLGRGQFDHTLLQPQPIWMALLTDGFNPFGASSAFLTGLGLALWASRSLSIAISMGWLALCVCNLLASATVVLAVSFFWGSLAFFAPRATEEINTPLIRMLDYVKLFPPHWGRLRSTHRTVVGPSRSREFHVETRRLRHP